MRALVQRVSGASVEVDGATVAEIGTGLLVFLGIAHDDGPQEAEALARKIAGLRIFQDEAGKMNLALADVGGRLLAVSQFTLYADVRKGRRPSFTHTAPPERAEPLYRHFCSVVAGHGIIVAQGIFQATMQVSLVNDGPVTIWIDSADLTPGR